MKKSLFLFLFPTLFSVRVSADGINALKVWTTSGGQVVFLLDEQPVVTFPGDEIVVTTSRTVLNYPSTDVQKFTYVIVDPSGISSSGCPAAFFSFEGNHISVSGLAAQSAVEVFSPNGKLLSRQSADSYGRATLSIPVQPGGLYIVKTSAATFKISKP